MSEFRVKGDIGLFRKLMLVMRVSYTLPFVMASICGVVYGLFGGGDQMLSLLIPLDVLFLAMFVNFSNDYFDHRSGVDLIRFRSGEETKEMVKEIMGERMYWDGNALDNGIITEHQGKVLMMVLVSCAVIISIPIIYMGGWVVIILGLIGLAFAFFYTAPPVNLGARGLGELDVLVSFFMITFFSYYVMVPSIDIEILLMSSILAVGAFNMRVIDQVSGAEAHLEVKERNVCYRIGPDRTARLSQALLMVTAALIVTMVIIQPWYLPMLFVLPLIVKGYRQLGMRDISIWYLRPVPTVVGIVLTSSMTFILSLLLRTVLPY